MFAPFNFNTMETDIPYVLFHDNGNQVVPNHWHREIEFSYSLRGLTRILVNDKVCELPEGEAVLINGGDTHFYFATKDHERLVIILDLSIVDGSKDQIELKKTLSERFDENSKTTLGWSEEEKILLKKIMERLEALNRDKSPLRTLAVRAAVYELLYLFAMPTRRGGEAEPEVRSASARSMENLASIFSYIEENYTRAITLTEIADYVGFDVSYFARFFKKHTNTTFADYLNSYRITKAQSLLVSQPDRLVGEIAEEVGFTSIKTFNRVFKKNVNTSPLKFRKVNI